MNESDTLRKLKEMAQITVVTGKISTVQEKNLKLYPVIFFNGVKEVAIEYDLSPFQASANGYDLVCKGPSFVSYRILTDGQENQDLERRCSILEKSVETLLWSGIVVEVFINGKLEYRSEPSGKQ